MFNTIISIAALLLPCHPFTAAFVQDPVAVPQQPRLMEEQVGLTLFQPRHANARDLIVYAKELTESNVQYLVQNSATGILDVRQRDRFVMVGSSIAVQGDEAGRKKGVDFLTELDAFMGKSRAERASLPEATTLIRTVRLRSMSVGSAIQLLDAMAANVEKQVVAEAGTIVLRGATDAVARAESLLLEVDKPAPQMTLHVTLIEAVDGAPTTPVTGDLGKALAGVMPGKQFQQSARFMLRGSVAGNAPLQISSSFGDHFDAKAKFMFQAVSRSFDAERKVLTLGGCEVHSERPKFVPENQSATGAPPGAIGPQGTQPGAARLLAGYDKEGFTTDLSLNQGQDTVVGSLGGNALLVVLRFTVDAGVN
jgi:hypothetical protein